ncbi:MAG: carotenoid oxygenase family protein [Phycicoccus sp.]
MTHDLGPGRATMEPAVVPRQGATAEDDGWVLSVVHDATRDRAKLVMLDAADVAAAPLARVHLPQRVPFGFHGNWVDDAEVDDPSVVTYTPEAPDTAARGTGG